VRSGGSAARVQASPIDCVRQRSSVAIGVRQQSPGLKAVLFFNNSGR